MKPSSHRRCPLRWIILSMLAVPLVAWAAWAGAGVRSVELNHCRAKIWVEGLALTAGAGAFETACARLTGYRRSRVLPAEDAAGHWVELEFEAASLTEASLRLLEWRLQFQPALRVSLEELTYHSAWLRCARRNVSLGMRQTLSTRDLDGTMPPE